MSLGCSLRSRKRKVSSDPSEINGRLLISRMAMPDDGEERIPVGRVKPKLRCRDISKLFRSFDSSISEASFVQLEDSDEETDVDETLIAQGREVSHATVALESEEVQRSEDIWACGRCTLHNSSSDSVCAICGHRQPPLLRSSTKTRTDSADRASLKKRRIVVDEEDGGGSPPPLQLPLLPHGTRGELLRGDEEVLIGDDLASDSDGDDAQGDEHSPRGSYGDEAMDDSDCSENESDQVIDLTSEPESKENEASFVVNDDIEDFDDTPGQNGLTFNEPVLQKNFM